MSVHNPAFDFARNSLLAYAIAQWSGYRVAGHHRRIANALERIESGALKRLMVFVPPRYGKSKLCSEFFPAWYMGRNPDKYIISVTYAQELADDWGRKVRDQLKDELHKAIFSNCKLRDDTAAANRLLTVQGGSYYAVGCGGPITGRGAHLLLIDDPIKGREDADSDLQRKKMREWYTSVAYTRLMPEASVVVIQTRWHEDDLAGWLLEEHAHEGWEVVSLPAIDLDGNALWPEAYPIERLRQIQKAIGYRDWSSLYQQEPVPDTNGYFEEKSFNFYDSLPEGVRFYGASDFAVTPDGGDFTEHGVFAVDSEKNLYLVDWWSGRTNAETWISAMIDLMVAHKPIMWIGESGAIKRSIEPFLRDEMLDRGVYCDLQWIPSIHTKDVRLRGFQAMCGMGKVYFPRALWADDVKTQLLKFPAGKYDDKVDVCGLIARALEDVIPGDDIQSGRKKRYDRYKRSVSTSWMSR